MQHNYQDLIAIFNRTFYSEFNTRLELGGDEPIYLPADNNINYHRIIFARGFYASALHEIAHWCVAGAKRRLLEDYGYWYQPDGRTMTEQAEFEKVEVLPQAYEWILAQSAGFRFTVSCDNLNGNFTPDRIAFMGKVQQQVFAIIEQGLPHRLGMLSQALQAFYQTPPLNRNDFKVN